MLIPFLIMYREGLEAALIVAIVASYLRQSGQGRWLPAVGFGIVSAAGLCLALGLYMNHVQSEFPQKQQELFEAIVALIATGMLTSMVFWMRSHAQSIKGELHHAIDAALQRHHRQAVGIVALVFLAVGREGLESVFFLLAAFQQDVGIYAPIGAVLGLAAAVASGVLIYRGSLRLNLRVFFQWSSIFILFVAAGLLSSALKAFHEAGLWNHLQDHAYNLSAVLPNGSVVGVLLGALFGYQDSPAIGEVLIWIAYIVPALWWFIAGQKQAPSAAPAAQAQAR
ncbi:FTR1 family protein [Curvibacter sp. CHRR-16]|uniref:iron uptake transporter permease EfeU n=1 Tax=Curvibacter sp. CHRR-16 TaxID=2835872 RepID=UPI001BD993DF|nr:iron uptake transporter permease EfeU [Curvibacter sp. CHRR-16]MBT0570009.1 FTR1 family protein [Curvibacter sp. CHRR-16]